MKTFRFQLTVEIECTDEYFEKVVIPETDEFAGQVFESEDNQKIKLVSLDMQAMDRNGTVIKTWRRQRP